MRSLAFDSEDKVDDGFTMMLTTFYAIFLSLLLLLTGLHAFEVPFPASATEIRRSVVISSASSIPVTRTQIVLGSGTKAEVITCFPPSKSTNAQDFLGQILFGTTSNRKTCKKPVLAFLHGSFHASWCWSEQWMPYFASHGYPCVALSLQGTGATPTVHLGASTVKIEKHVRDFDAFLRGLSDKDSQHSLGLELGNNPQIALVGHSFGGLTIMKWLEQYYDEENDENEHQQIVIAGICLLCSVPPSGNGKMTMRFLRRSLRNSWTIIAGFVLKQAITSKAICRDLFFGGSEDDNGLSDDDIARYQSYFKRDSVAIIDIMDLSKQLPSAKMDKQSGRAPFVDKLPSTLVIAATDDFIVDEIGSRETAQYLGVNEPQFVDSPHDIMLGNKWQNGADTILEWLDELQVV